ncbi:MAG TPA: hypothetical protein VEK08_26875 [Planctomycetota bacterium]|nr:hypothetical protein [Planctomycetota bacterium]
MSIRAQGRALRRIATVNSGTPDWAKKQIRRYEVDGSRGRMIDQIRSGMTVVGNSVVLSHRVQTALQQQTLFLREQREAREQKLVQDAVR